MANSSQEVRRLMEKLQEAARVIKGDGPFPWPPIPFPPFHHHHITAFRVKERPNHHHHHFWRKPVMNPQAPGFTCQFTATSIPAGTVPNPTTPPIWTSSDTVNAPVTQLDALDASVTFPPSAVVGTNYSLTISYTNADGSVATGTFNGTIVPAPSPDITGFTVTQSA